jgi:3-oxoacyl-[acyl-carrier-protein] synthase-1
MEDRRILSPANSNGFIPGEAGCAVLMQSGDRPGVPRVEILGIGIGHESATIDSDRPLMGYGLTEAVRNAFSVSKVTIFDSAYRITDLNGEHYKFKEAIFPEGRLMNRRYEGFWDLWHPIEYLGEIGAAVVPCVLG